MATAPSKAWLVPEAANNSDTAGALVPLLALGVPGGGATAVLLGAFIMYGIQPGPLLFQNRPDLVWGLVDSMYIGNLMLLILNLPLIGLFVKVLQFQKVYSRQRAHVAALSAYSLRQSWIDLLTLYVFSVLSLAMRRWNIPVAPAVIGLILGPLAETQARRALAISQGDPLVFITHPISASILAVSLVLLILPIIVRNARRS